MGVSCNNHNRSARSSGRPPDFNPNRINSDLIRSSVIDDDEVNAANVAYDLRSMGSNDDDDDDDDEEDDEAAAARRCAFFANAAATPSVEFVITSSSAPSIACTISFANPPSNGPLFDDADDEDDVVADVVSSSLIMPLLAVVGVLRVSLLIDEVDDVCVVSLVGLC
jgi:hypothetical protein